MRGRGRHARGRARPLPRPRGSQNGADPQGGRRGRPCRRPGQARPSCGRPPEPAAPARRPPREGKVADTPADQGGRLDRRDQAGRARGHPVPSSGRAGPTPRRSPPRLRAATSRSRVLPVASDPACRRALWNRVSRPMSPLLSPTSVTWSRSIAGSCNRASAVASQVASLRFRSARWLLGLEGVAGVLRHVALGEFDGPAAVRPARRPAHRGLPVVPDRRAETDARDDDPSRRSGVIRSMARPIWCGRSSLDRRRPRRQAELGEEGVVAVGAGVGGG